MIKRTIEISGYDTRLSVENNQIIVEQDDVLLGKIPSEDVGVLIVDAPSTNYSHSTVVELMNQESVVVLCGKDHMPVGMILPCVANSIQTERLSNQINASLPTKKRLWQQLIQAKIRNQAGNLSEESEQRKKLFALAESVKSGDPDNVEAQAARIYWSAWLGEETEFHRSREGNPPNNFLNYGYTIIRAALARAIVGAGFHPSIGLKHHNRYNPFCLADDLLEPFRPIVDKKVRELFLDGNQELDKKNKAELLSLLMHPVKLYGEKSPFMVALEKMVASLDYCYAGKSDKMVLPSIE